jgi:hypothetical protein
MVDSKLGLAAKLSSYALVIILLLGFAGVATYAVLSDNSIHGLTVKFYNVSWSCASGSTGATYTFESVVVYSSASLPTSLSHVLFLMSTNGVEVGNVTAQDSSFSAGQSASYTLTFTNSALDPTSQPTAPLIGLTIDAYVAAGIYGTDASSSYSEIVHLPSLAC